MSSISQQTFDVKEAGNASPGPLRVPKEGLISSLLSADEVRELQEHEAAIRETDFIQRWERYGRSRTDAPPEFHRMAALVLVATAIDRNRWLDLQHKRIYPAIYGLNLAHSGQRKSTPLDYAIETAVSAFKDRVLSNDYSAEALIDDLAV